MNKTFTNFSEETIQKVWEKAIIVPDYDQDQARHDSCGTLIYRDAYNTRDSEFGWVISTTSSDGVESHKPLQWRNFDVSNDKLVIGNCNC